MSKFYFPQEKMPAIVIGVDVETGSLRSDAFIFSAGASAWDVTLLRHIGCSYGVADANDEKAAAIFHKDPATMSWWEGKEDPSRSPCREAYNEIMSGTIKLPELLWQISKFVTSFADKNAVITMRGPEFDNPILMNAFAQCDVSPGFLRKFSKIDSDRTAHRMMATLGFHPDLDAEEHNWTCGNQNAYPHHAGYDATAEGYMTARAYHLMMLVNKLGYDRAAQANEMMRSGDYDPLPFIKDFA